MTVSVQVYCPVCKTSTEHRHMHDTAHGPPMTHMAGSERYECTQCPHTIRRAEGISLGLPFIYDRGSR